MPRYPWRFGAESGFSPRVCHWVSAIGNGGKWHAGFARATKSAPTKDSDGAQTLWWALQDLNL